MNKTYGLDDQGRRVLNNAPQAFDVKKQGAQILENLSESTKSSMREISDKIVVGGNIPKSTSQFLDDKIL